MNGFEMLLKGALAGLAISAPVGPVNVLCISRTLLRGRRSGLISGFGAATADTLYGAIAGFSISFVIQFLIREESRIKLIGGVLLIAIGIVYFFKKPPSLSRERSEETARSEYISTMMLTLTNPTVVLSFLAVLAALGLDHGKSSWSTLVLVGGIFVGAMLWWVIVANTANRFRDRVDDRAMVWMNRIGGMAVGAFGLLALVTRR